jgi:ElaB/YqjD/DUF883 family membrane-anchored ribosome-binding protein
MMNDMTFTSVDRDSERAGDTTARLAAAAREAADSIATRGRAARHSLERRAAELRAQAREQEARARAALSSQAKRTVGFVRRKPLVGVGIAFAAGVGLSRLLFRR